MRQNSQELVKGKLKKKKGKVGRFGIDLETFSASGGLGLDMNVKYSRKLCSSLRSMTC